MNGSTHKKVVIRLQPGPATGGRIWVHGHIAAEGLGTGPLLEVLTPAGQRLGLPAEAIQAVYFVLDFPAADAVVTPVASQRAQSRLPGLWVRVRGRDRQSLEGILASEMLELERGIWLTPLYPASAWQRVFVPRSAAAQITALEVVRPPRRRSAHPRRSAPRGDQFELFAAELNPAAGPGLAPAKEGT